MELKPAFTMRAMLRPPVDYGTGPFGHRQFFEVTGGSVTGERLNGQVLTGGGDWITVGGDGFGRLDVRAGIQADDGTNILVSYGGLLELNNAVGAAMAAGAATDFGDQYFRSTPRFEVGDERYAWLTQAVWVGEGRVVEGLGVEYRIHEVT
jgi:hypothetical protein